MPNPNPAQDEREIAMKVANEIFDTPYNDPDGDMCILSRQFLRAIEREATSVIAEKLARLEKDADSAIEADYQADLKSEHINAMWELRNRNGD